MYHGARRPAWPAPATIGIKSSSDRPNRGTTGGAPGDAMQEHFKHRREFSRSQTAVEVEITAGQRTVVGSTRDVSMNGLYLFGERSIAAGERCGIRLFLGGRETGIGVSARGRVARVDAGGMAVTFEEVDLEGYQHLKQLVLLNAADPDQTAEEIDQHRGLRRRQ